MKTKTILKTLLVGYITTIIATGCKKDKSDYLTPYEVQSNQNKKEATDIRGKICAYPYWTATEILADKAVDIYKKGATRDIFSQRPDHQADYFIEVKYSTDDVWNTMNYKLHFGSKKLPAKSYNEEGQFGFTRDNNNNKLLIDWIRPYEEPKYTFSNDSYYLESLQGNVLKLYSYDITLKTTVHLTFIGSNIKPF